MSFLELMIDVSCYQQLTRTGEFKLLARVLLFIIMNLLQLELFGTNYCSITIRAVL